jgi:type IV pilus assembly protein PilC
MISATIEPFIILILGAIVATILIAMYLPMFKLSTVIG